MIIDLNLLAASILACSLMRVIFLVQESPVRSEDCERPEVRASQHGCGIVVRIAEVAFVASTAMVFFGPIPIYGLFLFYFKTIKPTNTDTKHLLIQIDNH